MATDSVLRSGWDGSSLPGETVPFEPLLPGQPAPPMPEPAPDVVDPTPSSPPVVPDHPKGPEPLERPPMPVG